MKVFDEKQQEVINFNSGCALVLGAPGCGKTDILSHRVLRAHQVCRIDYRDMLCLTFTNRASREMKERIRTTIGDITGDLFVGNLHRFCIRFIYDNNLVPIDVCIVDDVEQEEIISELSTPIPVAAWQIRQVTSWSARKPARTLWFLPVGWTNCVKATSLFTTSYSLKTSVSVNLPHTVPFS